MGKYQEALDKLHKRATDYNLANTILDDKQLTSTLQELVDKEEKPVGRKFVEDNGIFSSHYICPKCNTKVSPICLYCENCGQRFKVEE